MKEQNIKISVVVPVFNMEKYLKYSMDSLISQDLSDMEFICINDGSTDSSLAVLKQYQVQDDRFVIIDQNNQGVAKSRNLGIRKAIGKYVAFLDPDDFLPDSNIMSLVYNTAENNDVLIAGGEFSDIDRDGKINNQYNGTLKGYNFRKEGIISYSDYQFDYGYHRFIYNREFLMDNQLFFPELVRFQDPPFMVRAFTLADKFYGIKKPTYCYRMDYRMIYWNKRKVEDLLTGLHMNIVWAAQYHLTDLMDLTIERMTSEYYEIIMDRFLKDVDIRKIIYDIINDETVNESVRIKNFYIEILNYLIQQYEHILGSKTYRVGNLITYLPRKIKKVLLSIAGGI